jgi:alpha-L-glutamate ligase-like protein
MAVSKLVLGMNARNYLYLRPLNKRSGKHLADDKLLTKTCLIKNNIPTTGLLVAFKSQKEVRTFDWATLPNSFVLKPARGFGGGGITVVRNWINTAGSRLNKRSIDANELEAEIFSILDGAYSLDNLPDVAIIEERVVPSAHMRKLSAKGVPDIRVIVCNKVPIMAMLRLPTEASEGKANLQQGALGVGIDLRTGITTRGVLGTKAIKYIPNLKTKVRGIKIPDWDKVLLYSVQAQEASGLGFAGIDLVHDEEKGPLILEMNARPGLKIQLANGASLRTRLERVSDLKIPNPEYGIELAKRIFAETSLAEVANKENILHIIEKVTIYGPKKKKTVQAKIDSGAFRTSLDIDLVNELELDLHEHKVFVQSGSGTQNRETVKVNFKLRNKDIHTVASFTDRSHLKFPMIIGRRDMKGFLIDPAAYGEEID